MRIGLGYDIHKLAVGENLVLGGIKIEFEKGTVAHSDGDVLVHALIDGILGALGKGDIGTHFPDTDPNYKNVNSLELLKKVCKMYPFKIINIDSNIICQKPKLAPYIGSMKEKIASILEIKKELISIKAKTNEGVESVGKSESIIANCAVLLEI